jgi:quercetin dioxygenase-like cupin family protein
MVPRIVRPAEARQISLYDVTFRYAIGATESDGSLSMLEVTIPPRTLIKPHMHTREDEYTLILDGSVSVRLGDETVEDIPGGSWLAKPRAIPHAIWNVSDRPARILEVVLPGGIERYFEEIVPVLSEHGPDWTKRYEALAEEYGLVILDDWTDETTRYGVSL